MTLVSEVDYPHDPPDAAWLEASRARRQAVLDAAFHAYVHHDVAIHVDDEMWRGLAESGSHQGDKARWARVHYMYGGRSAMRCITEGLIMADAPLPRRILDFPCGHGRVMRFLRAAFPDASLFGGDLNRGGVEFCARRFGSQPVPSQVDLEAVVLPDDIDLVWCGSLATHLDEAACLTLIRKLVDCLAPGGIAGITTCSRGMGWAQRNLFSTIEDERFESIEAQRAATGFGYADYPWSPGFGMTFVDLRWVHKVVELREDAYLLSYAEKAWHGAQDVMWIVKRPISHWYHWSKD